MKITLIGGMASGKTTVGKALAAKLNCPFFDTDQWIETHSNMTISAMFATHGEPFFRVYETRALEYFLTQENTSMVLATGGGIVKIPENRQLLAKHSKVVYLQVSITTQLARTAGDTSRPLLMTPDKAGVLTQLQTERSPWYLETATVVIDANQQPPETLATEIIQRAALSPN